MLKRRLIPCLDCDAGRVVKGERFQALRDCGDPAELARRYADQGADELVLLDISATVATRGPDIDTVRAVRAVLPLPLCVGGGVRSVATAKALLEAGADKVAVNSAALARPELLGELAAAFGRQAVVLAIDAIRDGTRFVVRSHAGSRDSGIEAVAWARQGTVLGAGEVLLTSIDRDGTGVGYDLELLAAVRSAISVPLIASGGARHAGHLAAALREGADAVLLASVRHDGVTTIPDLKRFLADFPLRP
jgi:imidazole glycerol-phosphate synthase subunit HisF